MIYDMEGGKFPTQYKSGETHLHNIRLNNLHSIVEVNQLGHRDENKLWIHTDPLSSSVQTQVFDIYHLFYFDLILFLY